VKAGLWKDFATGEGETICWTGHTKHAVAVILQRSAKKRSTGLATLGATSLPHTVTRVKPASKNKPALKHHNFPDLQVGSEGDIQPLARVMEVEGKD
jgi:hypothetical protein